MKSKTAPKMSNGHSRKRGKRVNAAAKGTRNEKRCEDALKHEGYLTWRVRRNRFANMDMFGLFDVVGWSPASATLRFIQVKSNRVDSKTMEKVAEADFNMPIGCTAEVWVWVDGRGWKIYEED